MPKYSVGDYIRVGITKFTYFRIIDIKEGRYTIKALGYKHGSLQPTFSLIDNSNASFVKVSKIEVMLFSGNKLA